MPDVVNETALANTSIIMYASDPAFLQEAVDPCTCALVRAS